MGVPSHPWQSRCFQVPLFDLGVGILPSGSFPQKESSVFHPFGHFRVGYVGENMAFGNCGMGAAKRRFERERLAPHPRHGNHVYL